MYANPIYQRNEKVLKDHGYHILEPASGALACGWEGQGKLPDPEVILAAAKAVLTPQDLLGCRVLVTAGPTREELDPVRYISNHSSGKMGFAIAEAARRRGGEVTLVSGPVNLSQPFGVDWVAVTSAAQMRGEVMSRAAATDVIIKAAAVADYRPVVRAEQKVKKKSDELIITLEKNPDILAELGRLKKDQILIGFAAETENLMEHATAKLKRKNLDMIVANDVSRDGAGFDVDTNIVRFLYADGRTEELDLMTKTEVAGHLLDRVAALWRAKRP